MDRAKLQVEVQGPGGLTETKAPEPGGLGLQSQGWSCQGSKQRRKDTKPEKGCLRSSSCKDECVYQCRLEIQSQRWARVRRLGLRKVSQS